MKKINKFIKNVKKIGVTLRVDKPSLVTHFIQIKKTFSRHNKKILLDRQSANMLQQSNMFKKDTLKNVELISLKDMCKKSDLLVCCGGDGTLLHLVKNSFRHKKPILGISGGNLSFLLNLKIEDLDKFIDKMFLVDATMNKHIMLKLIYEKNNFHIFNEVVFKSKDVMKTIVIDFFVNNELVNSYIGDGLIISTPTGSTAYNLSAKGPIVYPLQKSIIVTPISPIGLTQRPLVLPDEFNISISFPKNDGVFIVDGHSMKNVKKSNILHICVSKYKVSILNEAKIKYLKTLREKLLWGNTKTYDK